MIVGIRLCLNNVWLYPYALVAGVVWGVGWRVLGLGLGFRDSVLV